MSLGRAVDFIVHKVNSPGGGMSSPVILLRPVRTMSKRALRPKLEMPVLASRLSGTLIKEATERRCGNWEG